jgi:glycosyltransferase involved in cell wall biosynthesis
MNGIDLKAFTLEGRPHYKLKNRPHYKLKDDDFVLVFSGRVIPAKGIRSLILAMNELKDYPNIKLMIIGGSFYGNEARKTPFIEELIKLSWDVRQQIIFTGFMPYQEIPSLLSLADIAVLPSVWEEPLGLTCIEAMATGLPVITTNQGGIPETVTADCAVMLDVDETLPQRIATAILDLYEHPEKRKTMSEAAKKRSQLFSKERYAREFFEALERV